MKAIVDKANADTAPLRNVVIGRQAFDILRDNPARLKESAMGNMVADAMRLKYPEAEAAITNSGGLREDLLFARALGGEQPGEITWGEAFAVLPFGNSTVIETLTYAQLVAAFENGLKPPCGDSSGGTGRTPQFSGLKVTYHCNGLVPVIDQILKGDDGRWAPATRSGSSPTTSCSPVATATRRFAGGTDVLQTGDLLLDVLIEYIKANSPVAPVVDGRRVGP